MKISLHRQRKKILVGLAALAIATATTLLLGAGKVQSAGTNLCPDGAAGITLPPGFCATVFADDIGHARHLVVAPDGTVYVNTWSGRYYGNTPPHTGGFLVALKDTKGDGHADLIT